MVNQVWADVDRYFNDHLLPADPVLERALARSEEGGLPDIQVSPNQGKFLHLLIGMCGAKRVLEIGTLGGYSTIWIARALPEDGEVITLELEPRHAEVARKNLDDAGLLGRVAIKVGRAVDTLAEMHAANPSSFDFIFIDADKPSNPDYWQWALKFSRPGTVIFVDNVVRNGGVVGEKGNDPNVTGVRRMTELIARESRVEAVAMQTVGSKSYDGFLLARVVR